VDKLVDSAVFCLRCVVFLVFPSVISALSPPLYNLCTTIFPRGYPSFYLGTALLPSVDKFYLLVFIHISVYFPLRMSPPPVDDPTLSDHVKRHLSPESTGPTTTTTYNYLGR
jgi:hypothetical protein